MTNIRVETKTLQHQDFPLIFKICAQPAFKEKKVFQENGYSDVVDYFEGANKFNKSIYGWAGHTSNSSEPLSTVNTVYHNVSMFSPEDIVRSISVKLKDGTKRLNLNHSHVYLQRVNYPLNCFTLNLTRYPEVKQKGLETMTFHFKRASDLTGVQINTQGYHLASYRDFFDHSFYTTGDAILGKPRYFNKYGIEISESVFVQEDPSKHCLNYPTAEYESFGDCDYQYMLDKCTRAGVSPIWLAENFRNVTTQFIDQGSSTEHTGRVLVSFTESHFNLKQRRKGILYQLLPYYLNDL